jgi:hypothetical protein
MRPIWVCGKTESFCEGDWTGQITLMPLQKIAPFETEHNGSSACEAKRIRELSLRRPLPGGMMKK